MDIHKKRVEAWNTGPALTVIVSSCIPPLPSLHVLLPSLTQFRIDLQMRDTVLASLHVVSIFPVHQRHVLSEVGLSEERLVAHVTGFPADSQMNESLVVSDCAVSLCCERAARIGARKFPHVAVNF